MAIKRIKRKPAEVFKRPIWGIAETVLLFFGFGKDELHRYRVKGFVLTKTEGKSVQYNFDNIDEAMTREALGLMPRVIDEKVLMKFR
jgi:hypothetical protein